MGFYENLNRGVPVTRDDVLSIVVSNPGITPKGVSEKLTRCDKNEAQVVRLLVRCLADGRLAMDDSGGLSVSP